MKIEVGKKYRLRNGDTVTIAAIDDQARMPVIGRCGKNWEVFKSDGSYYSDGTRHECDIIAEIHEPREIWATFNEKGNFEFAFPKNDKDQSELHETIAKGWMPVLFREVVEGDGD